MQLLDEVRANCARDRRGTRAASRSTSTPGRSRRPRRCRPGAGQGGADSACSSSTRSTSARAGSRRCASGPACRATGRSRRRVREHGAWDNDELRRLDAAALAAVLGQDDRPPADAPLRRGAARAGPLPGRPLGARPGRAGRRLRRAARRPRSPAACASSTTAASTSAPRSCRATWRWRGWPSSATSTRSRSSPTTSCRTCCAWTACCATTPSWPPASTPASCCPRAAPSARSAPARCTPASSSPQRTGIPARLLDVRLWNRGQAPEYKAIPRHRTRSVYY